MKQRALQLALAVAGLWISMGWAEARPTLRVLPSARVAAEDVRLGAVARFTGVDRDERARLSAISLGPAPELGRRARFSRDQIADRLTEAGVEGVAVKLPRVLEVQRAAARRSGAHVAAQVRRWIEEHMPHSPEQVAAVHVAVPADVQVPAGAVLHIEGPGPDTAFRGRLPMRALFKDGDRVVRRLYVQATVDLFTEACLAAVPLSSGDVVTEDVIQVVRLPESEVPRGAIADPASLAGARMTRSVKAGEPIGPRMVKRPPLMRRGDRVDLVVRQAGFVVTARGEVVTYEALAGDTVQVRNLTSRKVITGRAKSSDLVVVGGE